MPAPAPACPELSPPAAPAREEVRRLVLRLRRDPVFFCREVLGVAPWRKQVEVLRALRDADRVAVRSGHGTGKSFVAAAAALWFLYAHHPAKVVTTAPTWNQVRHVLWPEIRRLHAGARCPLGGRVLEERLRLSDDAFAIGFSTDEPERFQGFHAEHLLVILDEAPGVRGAVWEAAATLLTGRSGKMLAIGNPTAPHGPFYRAFAPGSGWRTVRISCLDSPNLAASGSDEPAGNPAALAAPAEETDPPGGDGAAALRYPRLVTRRWILDRAREWGTDTPLWKSRVLGEFPEDAVSRLIPRAWLEAAAAPDSRDSCVNVVRASAPHADDALMNDSAPPPARGSGGAPLPPARRASGASAPPDAPEGEPSSPAAPGASGRSRGPGPRGSIRLGVDVARGGGDETVFLLRDERSVLRVEAARNWSTMETAGHVVRLMEAWSVPPARVFVDDTGLGAGVTDRLRELGHGVTPVVAAARAEDAAHFLNRRAECFWRLRRALDPDRPGGALRIPPPETALLEELGALACATVSTGQVRIESKVTLRGLLARSPDRADALALTFAAPAREPAAFFL